MDPLEIGAKLGLYFVPFLFSLCFHEYAHGWVAEKLGDSTARLMGRLTLNPVAHADLIGTIILPAASIIFGFPFFGWAKPVPVNERNLRHPRKDMFWVAFAGPASNFLLAIVGTIVMAASIRYLHGEDNLRAALEFLKTFIMINLFLAFFNLIPLHPLDGAKVLARFLSHELNEKLEQNQGFTSMLLLFLFMSGAFAYIAIPVYQTYGYLIKLVEMIVA